jgi:hypothetical protein
VRGNDGDLFGNISQLTSKGEKGIISPNFLRQVKSCRRTAFGEEFTVQFHQHSASNCANEVHPICFMKFAKLMRHLLNAIHQKKLLILFSIKNWAKCW